LNKNFVVSFSLWLASITIAVPLLAQSKPTQAVKPAPKAWVVRSDENAQILIQIMARFTPEDASSFGAEGFDEQIIDLKPNFVAREHVAVEQAIHDLQSRLASEKDPLVRQDLEILIDAAQRQNREQELEEKYQIPYLDMSRTVFLGMRSLLDDQEPQERRQKALIRLKRYAGTEPGYEPITVLAERYTRSRMNTPGLIGPYKGELEKDLAQSQFFVDGIARLLAKFQISGYEQSYAKLKVQLTAYNDFLRKEIAPKARNDFRLPAELYAFRLEDVGVDIPPAELAGLAHAAFDGIQKQMQALAPAVAKQRGFSSTDYRDVIRELKKDQFQGDAILAHYQKRIAEIEQIIRREHLVTLPDRPMRIRLASEAEAANIPAPNMHMPRLIGNTGEVGEFVLPLTIPSAAGAKPGTMQNFDDFTFSAASWTLTAHEGRPGHELQFDSMIERGVSLARAIFAFNSTNVEGWGLYSEYIMQPYMPPDGQLVCLQHRLLRSARAFLDPELESGKVTPEQAKRVLTQDVVLSDVMANQEVERYMFRAPGQATSYFYGYTKLVELRKDTQQALGKNFDQQKFHDFILAQGLLPPALLRKAVMEEFVPRVRAKTNAIAWN